MILSSFFSAPDGFAALESMGFFKCGSLLPQSVPGLFAGGSVVYTLMGKGIVGSPSKNTACTVSDLESKTSICERVLYSLRKGLPFLGEDHAYRALSHS